MTATDTSSMPIDSVLTEQDLPDLVELALACLDADGGLPALASEAMLRRLFLSGVGVGVRDTAGAMVAAAAIFQDGDRPAVTGMVRPSARGAGLGRRLAGWATSDRGEDVPRIRTETVSPATEAFLRERGFHRIFAEHVMRHDLSTVPQVRRPGGTSVRPFTDRSARRFHDAYRRSFADRPGFPDPPRDEWLSGLLDDEEFRPELSRVVVGPAGDTVGFVTVVGNWIDQVGTVPDWRGRGLGAHLVARTLRALRDAGASDVWLAVDVDNPARLLYRRLGFDDAGLRGRYETVGAASRAPIR